MPRLASANAYLTKKSRKLKPSADYSASKGLAASAQVTSVHSSNRNIFGLITEQDSPKNLEHQPIVKKNPLFQGEATPKH